MPLPGAALQVCEVKHLPERNGRTGVKTELQGGGGRWWSGGGGGGKTGKRHRKTVIALHYSGLVYFPENFTKFFTFPVTSNL